VRTAIVAYSLHSPLVISRTLALHQVEAIGLTHPFLGTINDVVFSVFSLLGSRLDIRDVTTSVGFLGTLVRAGSARGQVTHGNSNADPLLAGDQIW